jgi:hypothetical protein
MSAALVWPFLIFLSSAFGDVRVDESNADRPMEALGRGFVRPVFGFRMVVTDLFRLPGSPPILLVKEA